MLLLLAVFAHDVTFDYRFLGAEQLHPGMSVPKDWYFASSFRGSM